MCIPDLFLVIKCNYARVFKQWSVYKYSVSMHVQSFSSVAGILIIKMNIFVCILETRLQRASTHFSTCIMFSTIFPPKNILQWSFISKQISLKESYKRNC